MSCGPFEQQLDDLLAQEEVLPCELEHYANHLGWLDDDDENTVLEPGKKLELPAYLAKALVLESHASIFVPRCYGDRARESMRADPEVLNLREKNEHFFMHGMCVVELLQDEDVSETLRGTLLDTFVRRYRRILDTSLTGADSDPTGLTHRLSMTEAKLFFLGHSSTRDYHRWKARQAGRLTACEIIRLPSKRLRLAQ